MCTARWATAPDRGDVVELARGGDARAWTRLYRDHFDRLSRRVAYLMGGADVAEDIVQETFTRALGGAATFDRRSSLATWLHGIATNVMGRHWRSHVQCSQAYAGLQAEQASLTPPDGASPERDHLNRQRADVLLAVLETVPQHLREPFVQRCLHQRPISEVARRLEISPGNVRVRTHRARTWIRNELVRLGWIVTGEQAC